MNCKDIIEEYLTGFGFDGLQGDECGCDLSDLVPCENDFSYCTPGFKVIPPPEANDEFGFYICASKEDRPWED